MSFRITVEGVFVIKNRGVVATGRVESGVLRVGDTVHIDGGPGVTAVLSASGDATSTAFIV